jgi:hypothetical protein
MRLFNTIIIIVNTLIFLALGAFLVSAGFSEATARGLGSFQHWLENAIFASLWSRALVVCSGILFLAVALSTVVGNLRTRRYERAVVMHNPMGEVMIALGALEDLGKVIRNEVEGLKDIKMRVSARRKRISVTAKVTLWSDCSLAKASSQTQDAIRAYLQDILGSEQDIRPKVVVSKVAFRETEGESRELGTFSSARRKAGSFRGPIP